MQTLKEILEDNIGLTWFAENNVGTDKGSGHHGEHNYIDGFYDKEFARYQDKEISLLEIGIFGGASLALWSKYFTNANIVGIDIADNVPEKYKYLDRVTHVFKDAYSYDVAESLGNFDIIIDDGPHTLDSMIQCIRLYFDKINDGGILVIEDLQDPAWFDLLRENVPNEYQDNIEYIDLRKNVNRHDDLLFIVRK